MSLQFLFLLSAQADKTDVAFAIGICFDDARETPLVSGRIFGDEDVADDDVAAVAGPFPALLK